MIDNRPANCRFRLIDEKKAYGRSSCGSCRNNVMTGLKRETCPHSKDAPIPASHDIRKDGTPANQLRVWLDDVKMNFVVAYDIQGNWIEKNKLDDNGNVSVEGDDFVYERLYGVVRVELADE